MRRHALILAAAATAGSVCAVRTVAVAQVMQVGPSGEVVVFDRPVVFDGSTVSPIGPPKSSRLRGRRRAPAQLVKAAREVELSPDLVEAVAREESGLRSRLVSRAGAIGEMQLMPSTARAVGVDPRSPADNYRGGAAYLRLLMRRYDGDVVRTLSAYNAGPGAVDRYGGTPPYKETRAYVAAVLERLGRRALEEGEAK